MRKVKKNPVKKGDGKRPMKKRARLHKETNDEIKNDD